MDYSEKKYLKTYKPNPNYLYFHPGNLEVDSWSCCGVSPKCYKGKRGCRRIESNWKNRKALVFVYETGKDQDRLNRLPMSLFKEIVAYI
jgi:hypothetical protein